MSDERLRELERRWKETGAVEDEAQWLAERVRTGVLPLDLLASAALLGHASASRALGQQAPSDGPASPQDWIATVASEVARLGPPKLLLAGLISELGNAAMPEWLKWEEFIQDGNEGPRLAQAAVDAWVTCPCDDHALALLERVPAAYTESVWEDYPRAESAARAFYWNSFVVAHLALIGSGAEGLVADQHMDDWGAPFELELALRYAIELTLEATNFEIVEGAVMRLVQTLLSAGSR